MYFCYSGLLSLVVNIYVSFTNSFFVLECSVCVRACLLKRVCYSVCLQCILLHAHGWDLPLFLLQRCSTTDQMTGRATGTLTNSLMSEEENKPLRSSEQFAEMEHGNTSKTHKSISLRPILGYKPSLLIWTMKGFIIKPYYSLSLFINITNVYV